MLPKKEIILVVPIAFVKPSVMQKLDGIKIIFQLITQKPSKHLRSNIDHCFTWAIISNTPNSAKIRNNIKVSNMALRKLELNN